jgi:predicted transcriptional regulator
MGRRNAIEAAELAKNVWNQYLGGKTQDVIAEMYGITQGRVSQIVSKRRKEISEKTKEEEIEEIRGRYEALLGVHWDQAVEGDALAGSIVMRIEKEKRQMLGLDAATKVELNGKVATYRIEGVDPKELI